ncbi:hypothetical protein JOC86_001570 [Bacillus pakistanensis]|uniref:NERD domain-containing protein n=1 Tax=Rossellomorea pakistanensis TaxID=992288 RepID=A0ABS2NAZ7_9BACI|nr:NERD domain-containing protein [Bacillus pakistanensis]MBM7585033.1 hypothetical protein [Bacillus pakistanensis]
MAQLIKLQDYASRYGSDLYRYPSQFVRLKKQQWEKLKGQWENGEASSKESLNENNEIKAIKQPLVGKLKGLFMRDSMLEDQMNNPSNFYDNEAEEIDFTITMNSIPATINDLKMVFLDQLYPFQLKWASSTLTEKSYVDQSFIQDERLRYLLQRFPDNILVLYFPIFYIKKAPVEMELILISPTDVWCLAFLEEVDQTVYLGSQERFWIKKWGEKEGKVLNPMISLRRMENIISQIFLKQNIEIPLKKGIISRNGFIDFPLAPHDLQLLDKRRYDEWFGQMRSLSSPIKKVQLKAAQSLLEYCQTTSFKRFLWEDQQDIEFMNKKEID